MKKGILILIFFAFVLCFAGCEHTHSASTEWKSDQYYHWHPCQDDCLEMFDKAAHTWDKGVITKEATEQTDGEKTYTCTSCSATRTEIVYALGHTHDFSDEYSHDEVFHWFAATCGHEEEVKFKELHKYEFEQQSPATCTSDEVLIGTCVCGDTTIKIGQFAIGHKYTQFEFNNDATCTSDGTKTGTCDVCGEVDTFVDEGSMLEHGWVQITIPATYESTGEIYRKCDDCGEIESIEILPQLIAVDDFEISGKSYMGINSTQTLVANVLPKDASDKSLTWTSSDKTIATVDENGNVTALKLGTATITATSHNNVVRTFNVKVIENTVDGEKDDVYSSVTPLLGDRTSPALSQETYVYLGESGIHVYQYSTDSSKALYSNGSSGLGNAHSEVYFTLGDTAVLDGSFSVHLYYEGTDNLRTYTYNSANKVSRNNNLRKYCEYSIKLISDEDGTAIVAYELFIDYSYFGLTEAPETIKAQTRVVAGYKAPTAGGYASLVNKISSGDYRLIVNYYTFDKNGLVPVNHDLNIDAEKDDKYNSLTPLTVEKETARTDLGHESYIYFGKEGIYAYHLATDKTALSSTTHVEWYFTLGEDAVLDNSLSVHIYYQNAVIKSYKYTSSTAVKMNNDLAKQFCEYSVKQVGTDGDWKTYAYELFVDYDYFGITEAPESMKIQIKTIQGKSGPLTNTASGSPTYNDIANYVTFDKNGYVMPGPELTVDAEKDEKYDSVTPLTGSRTSPALSQETYVYLGEKGIYVYLYSTDNSKSWASSTDSGMGNAHCELYFTLGTNAVLDNSFAVHLYYEGTDNLRTYTYSSTAGVARNNNLMQYCDHSIKLISEENGIATIAYELFVDYSYFGLTKAPESIKVQSNVGAGYKKTSGYPSLVNATTSGDYKLIENYYTFNKNGLVTEEEAPVEIDVDGIKDEKYASLIPMIGKRSDPFVGQEAYLYLGEKGIYVYHIVTDSNQLVEKQTHVEWYFTLGDTAVLDNSFSVHLYPGGTDNLRTYKYSSTAGVSRDNNLRQYCDHSIKVISDVDNVITYTYELFVDYSYFGLTEAPQSIKAQLRAQSAGSPLTNSTEAGTLDYKNIANYYTFDHSGYVYSTIGVRDLELDPTDIVSGKYEREFTLQTLNILNKLSGAKFSGVGSEYITEVGNGKYKISIPVDKMADFAKGQTITIVDARNLGVTFTVKILEEAKNSIKLLMIGNSFSDDTIQWMHEICEDLGIEITVANLYIGGATLDKHLNNLLNDVNAYTYAEYDKISKTWIRSANISIAEALTYEKWNYISLQQGSALSGQADTYDDIDQIMDEVLKLKADVKFIWNMTWAYQQDSTHSAFPNYNSDQTTMYNAIVNAVQTKVLTNNRIELVNPIGTAIQNARTSFVGDTLTRDGHHLSLDLGRYIAGLTMVGTLTGADLTQVQYSPNLSDKHRNMAIEAAINAIKNPYVVTQSTYIE